MKYHGRDPLAVAKKKASFPFACTSKYKVFVSHGNTSLLLPPPLLLNMPFKILLRRVCSVNWSLSESSLCSSIYGT